MAESIDWVETSLELLDSTNPRKGICSTSRFYSYYCVFARKGDSQWFEMDCPCACYLYRHRSYLRNHSLLMPVTKTNIVIGCSNCSRQTMRITGILTNEWRLFIHRDIYMEI